MSKQTPNYTSLQQASLTILRVLIGWHFLYEGLIKLYDNSWSAAAYLEYSTGPLSEVFRFLSSSDTGVTIIDALNTWGLILIGLSLFIGLFERIGTITGMVLLLLYYAAYPPIGEPLVNLPVEGNYWIVNKNLIEIAALFVLFTFPSGNLTGLAFFTEKWTNKDKY